MSSSSLVLLLHCLRSNFLYKLNRYLENEKENQAETQLWKFEMVKNLSLGNGSHCPFNLEKTVSQFFCNFPLKGRDPLYQLLHARVASLQHQSTFCPVKSQFFTNQGDLGFI